VAIYTAKCPEKLNEVDLLVEKYRGKESEALQVLTY
jgi:hypothetical protein